MNPLWTAARAGLRLWRAGALRQRKRSARRSDGTGQDYDGGRAQVGPDALCAGGHSALHSLRGYMRPTTCRWAAEPRGPGPRPSLCWLAAARDNGADDAPHRH